MVEALLRLLCLEAGYRARSVEDVLREAGAAMYRHKAGSRPDPTSGPPAPDPGPAGALTAPAPADPADGAE